MAAGTLPKPGTEFGPCFSELCGHKDCDSTREMAESKCPHCLTAIGYDRRFYQGEKDGKVIYEHAACLEMWYDRGKGNWPSQKRFDAIQEIAVEMMDLSQRHHPSMNQTFQWGEMINFLCGATSDFLDANSEKFKESNK